MEENIIISLQSSSNEFYDAFFKIISHAVSWVGALVIFLVILLLINKKFGLTFGLGLLGIVGVNYLIKMIVNRPRPFEVNDLIINKLSTIGMSFPSGHMVSATFIVFSVLFLIMQIIKNKESKLKNNKWLWAGLLIVGVLVIVLTGISRMYLGQHYLTDLFGGFVVGIFGFIITCQIYKKVEKK